MYFLIEIKWIKLMIDNQDERYGKILKTYLIYFP